MDDAAAMKSVVGLAMPDADPDEFSSLLGARVRLQNLTARPELNGCVGRVMSWHAHKGRAGVKLTSDRVEHTLALKPENLLLIEDASPQVAPG